MDEYDFQRFSREIWERNGFIVHVYGTRFELQRGIDLLALDCTPGQQGAGQCKRQKKFTVGNLRAAVQEFLRHRRWWRGRNVRQFKLFVACRCDSTKLVEELLKLTTRLKKIGIQFELLDADRLLAEAKRHTDIIAQYLGPNWVPVLCGSETVTDSGAGFGASEPSLRTWTGVFTEWSEFKNKELDGIREEFRCGRALAARQQLIAFRQSLSWKELSEQLQARTLRLLASITLDLGGSVAEARRLVEEARRLDASERVQVLDALLAYHEGTAADGLLALGQPHTVDAWNVQLALWLANGDATRVIDAMTIPSFPPNAETRRLHAMALLFAQRIEEAEAAIAESIAAQPEWSAMRQSQAMIDYATTVSPHFHAWGHLTWPVPSESALVKSDDASRVKLARSAAAFERLLAEMPPDTPRRADLETWRLATLANNPDTVAEAERWASELLEKNPANFRVVIWALERGFKIDRTRVRMALAELVNSPDTELDAIIALVHLTSMDRDLAGARALLEKMRARFVDGRSESLWRFLMVQVLVRLSDDSAADALLVEETDEGFRRKERALVATIRAQRSPEAAPSPDPFIQNYEATGSPEDLLAAAEACVYTRPAWVVDHTEALLAAFPTAGILRLALVGAWRTDKFPHCVTLLADHQDRFPGGRLPADLRRLEVQCLWNSGKRVEALRRQEAFVADTDDAEALSDLLQQQLTFADQEGCLRTARALLAVEDPPSGLLLHAAALLAATNREAAVELWTAATARKLTQDEAVMLALDVGFRLGLEDQSRGLMEQMQRIALRGSKVVKAMPVEEVIAEMRRRREGFEELNRHYDTAAGPIHMLTTMSGISLAEIYHVLPTENEKARSLLNRAPLFVRYGGRQSDQSVAIKRGRLLVDVTGLLCAAHFDLLDLVEQQFGPLLISASLLDCLRAQLRQVEPNQPGLDDARRNVLRMIKEGRLAVLPDRWPPLKRRDDVGRRMGADWCAALDYILQNDGWLVEDVPLIRFDDEPGPVVLPSSEHARVISRGELLEALRRAEQLDVENWSQTTEILGERRDIADREIALKRGQIVFLTNSQAEWLARTPAFDRLCSFTRVHIAASQHQQLEREVSQANARRELADWLRRLIDRTSVGLRTGRYIEVQVNVPQQEAVKGSERPEIQCLYDLLWDGNQATNTVWCDDRFLSASQNAPGGPLVGTWEVLNCIHESGGLTDDEHHARVIRLRRANVRYLPLSSEEILYHLRNAPIREDVVQETPELAVLRQSVAAALLDAKKLLLPSPQHLAQRDLAELRWATALAGQVMAAIVHLWHEKDLARAKARADWIWDNLHWDLGAIRDLHPRFLTNHEDGAMFAAEVGQFFSAGGLLPSGRRSPGDGAADSPRRAFFRWLWLRKVQPTLATNSELRALVAKELTDHAEEMVAMLQQFKVPERAAAVHVHHVLADLPEEMQQDLQPPPTLARVLGIRPGRAVVETGGHEFLPTDFWRAVTSAINGGTDTVDSIGGVQFIFRAGETRNFGHAVIMARNGTNQQQEVTGTWLPLLLHSEPQRRAFLESDPALFDLQTNARKDAIVDVIAQASGLERIQSAELHASRSGECFYRDLERRLCSGDALEAEAFVPKDVVAITTHLRLPETTPVDLNRAAETLLEEVGLEDAVFRLCGLPVPLPSPLIAASLALESDSYAQFFANLRRRCVSPIGRLALFHLATQRAAQDPAGAALAIEVRDEILNSANGRDLFEGFVLLLRWSFERLRLSSKTASWHPSVFLAAAWAHTFRVHNLLLRHRIRREAIQAHFHVALGRLPRFVWPERAGVLNDAAAYLHAQWSVLLVRGLGGALAVLPKAMANRFCIEKSALSNALTEDEEDRMPMLHLMAETGTRSNSLGSFLGGEWETPLRALLGETLFAEWFDSSAEQIAFSQLDALENDPVEVSAWVVLWGLIGDSPFPSAGRERLVALINAAEFAPLMRREPTSATLALNFVCAQARYLGDAQLRSRIEGQLLACAQECCRVHETSLGSSPNAEPFADVVGTLIEAAFWLSPGEAGGADESSFSNLAVRLTRVCPEIGLRLRKRLGARVGPLPIRVARGLWPLYLAIRAAP